MTEETLSDKKISVEEWEDGGYVLDCEDVQEAIKDLLTCLCIGEIDYDDVKLNCIRIFGEELIKEEAQEE